MTNCYHHLEDKAELTRLTGKTSKDIDMMQSCEAEGEDANQCIITREAVAFVGQNLIRNALLQAVMGEG